MNRHLLPDDMPSEALGTPIRSEKSGPQDGEWQPHIPGYEVRTLADGRREIRPTPGSLAEMLNRPVKPTGIV